MNSALMQKHGAVQSGHDSVSASDSVVSSHDRARKAVGAFRTISEVAEDLDVPQHVLRFWETKFNQVRPLKRGGGRRYYRPEDVALLKKIHHLLYTEGYTIKGVQKILKGVSKSQLVNERVEKPLPTQAGAQVFGDNLPQVQAPVQTVQMPESTAISAETVFNQAVQHDVGAAENVSAPVQHNAQSPQSPQSLADYKAALEETLKELMEMRALLQQAS